MEDASNKFNANLFYISLDFCRHILSLTNNIRVYYNVHVFRQFICTFLSINKTRTFTLDDFVMRKFWMLMYTTASHNLHKTNCPCRAILDNHK